ncbi:MAG: thiamine phosphate synthase [Acidobacteria bacterium]|nr:thiamine phosphate synthase [Acidobacteriota bacterium]
MSEEACGAALPRERPLYYYITDRRALTPRAFCNRVRRLAAWGIDLIQVREKDLSDLELCLLTEKVLSLVAGTRCRVLVNGRADIALAVGAHGVHLPSQGLRPADVRAWVPRGFLIGVSTHSLRQARMAEAEGADYILLGPVFETPSKLRYGPPLGLGMFRRTCRTVRLPVFGIGGITREAIQQVVDAGAVGVAAIRLFQESAALDLPRMRSFGSARTPDVPGH